ncbi:MAG: DUF4230 domain-containing protein, partial [Oscillospiraceae bacterium]|nr:DUF4230 domain-containing protein [Oscillospiraceae bacterium]
SVGTKDMGEEKKELPLKVIVFAIMTIIILILSVLLLSSGNRSDRKDAKNQDTIDDLTTRIEELEEEKKRLEDQLKKAETITVEDVRMRIELVGELVTAKDVIHGFIPFKEGSIPIFAQKSFIMFYEAEMSAYFDLSKVTESIVITDTTVELTLPPVSYTAIRVDPDSIQFFDKQFSLFKREEMQDAIDCIAKAEEHAKYEYDKSVLEVAAINQAKSVLSALLRNFIGERELIIHETK